MTFLSGPWTSLPLMGGRGSWRRPRNDGVESRGDPCNGVGNLSVTVQHLCTRRIAVPEPAPSKSPRPDTFQSGNLTQATVNRNAKQRAKTRRRDGPFRFLLSVPSAVTFRRTSVLVWRPRPYNSKRLAPTEPPRIRVSDPLSFAPVQVAERRLERPSSNRQGGLHTGGLRRPRFLRRCPNLRDRREDVPREVSTDRR
jgi:hypothetical protein